MSSDYSYFEQYPKRAMIAHPGYEFQALSKFKRDYDEDWKASLNLLLLMIMTAVKMTMMIMIFRVMLIPDACKDGDDYREDAVADTHSV